MATTGRKCSAWVPDDEPVFPADKSRQRPSFCLINLEWEWNARELGRPKNCFRRRRTQPRRPGNPTDSQQTHDICLPSTDDGLSYTQCSGLKGPSQPVPQVPLNASVVREDETEQAGRTEKDSKEKQNCGSLLGKSPQQGFLFK